MNESKTQPNPAKQLAFAALFGIAFGFLLQKGGVAKLHVLIGVLLLKDFTVIKVMLSAITVGMLGVGLLHAFGKVNLHIKPTRLERKFSGDWCLGSASACWATVQELVPRPSGKGTGTLSLESAV